MLRLNMKDGIGGEVGFAAWDGWVSETGERDRQGRETVGELSEFEVSICILHTVTTYEENAHLRE